MISLWRGTFKSAFQLSKVTFQKYPILLALTFLATFFINLGAESPFAAPQTSLDDTTRILTQLILVLWSLIEGFLLFLFTVNAPVESGLLERQTALLWNKEAWVGLAAEPLRALMWIILWTFALIIPGMIYYVLYSFVMYIVLFSKEYQAGEQDALELSKNLVKPMFFPFVGLTILVSGGASAVSSIPSLATALSGFPARLLCELIGFLISVYGYSLMRILFHKAMIRHLSHRTS